MSPLLSISLKVRLRPFTDGYEMGEMMPPPMLTVYNNLWTGSIGLDPLEQIHSVIGAIAVVVLVAVFQSVRGFRLYAHLLTWY